MICDEVVKDCLVKACCTEVCPEVKNLMENNQRMVKSAIDYAYGNMRKNEYCPVCHTQYFSYQLGPDPPLTHTKVDKIYLVCRHCWAGINLVSTDDHNEWRIDYSYFPKLSKLSNMEPRYITRPIEKLENIFKIINTINKRSLG